MCACAVVRVCVISEVAGVLPYQVNAFELMFIPANQVKALTAVSIVERTARVCAFAALESIILAVGSILKRKQTFCVGVGVWVCVGRSFDLF